MTSVAELVTSQRGEPLNPPSGSKLEMVVNTLREKFSRGEVFFTGPAIKIEPTEGFSEWVDFFVAPPKGIFDAERLEKFRAGLFPNVESSNYSRVRDRSEGGMDFGFIAFDDHLVNLERTTSTADVEEHEPGALARLARLGLKTDETRRNERFDRRTIIHVVPHPIVARVLSDVKTDAMSWVTDYFNRLEHGASSKVLKKVEELARKKDGGRGSSYGDYVALRDVLIEEKIALLIGSISSLSPERKAILQKLLS